MEITIQLYNPAVDAAPHDETFEVEYHDKMTVLEAICAINDTQYPIAFDFNCRGRICGRCAVSLDGTPCLACVTMIDDAPHSIAPQSGFAVIRDLIVDKDKAHAVLAERYNRVRTKAISEEEAMTYDPAVIEPINGIEWCARCMCCQSVCPVFNENGADYVGPAFMLATVYRALDPYDEGDRVVEAVQDGLWNCIMCGQCTSVCNQAEIDHVSLWQTLRDAATERGLTAEALEVTFTDGKETLYKDFPGLND